MSLALLVFDCDGVILESVDIKGKAFYQVGLLYGQEAADRLYMFHKVHGGTSRFAKFEWLFEEVLHKTITEQDKTKLNKYFVTYCLEELKNSPLVVGVEEVLQCWKGRVPMYVASGAPHEELLYVLEYKQLTNYFDGIYGSPPGKTALLRMILEQTKALPKEVVMVGDSQVDLVAAEETGTLFYGRGDIFSATSYPYYDDLTKLTSYLNELYTQNK